MAEPFNAAKYVPVAAAAMGLPLAPDDLGGVIGAFSVLARVAQPVMDFQLAEDVVAASIFTPDDGSTG